MVTGPCFTYPEMDTYSQSGEDAESLPQSRIRLNILAPLTQVEMQQVVAILLREYADALEVAQHGVIGIFESKIISGAEIGWATDILDGLEI